MRAVDTNVVVRILTEDDASQFAAAEAFISAGAWVSILALAEAVWVLGGVYGLSAMDIAAAVEMLLNHEHLVLQDADTVAAAVDLFRSRPSLGFADCLLIEIARKAGYVPLGTFDRDLGKLAGAQTL